MAHFPLTGGCQCGAVRYSLLAPAISVHHCHCSMCRKLHGAMFASFAIMPRDAVVIDRGADQLKRFDSSPTGERYFCRNCGCQIYSDVVVQPEIRYLAVGTLDGGAHPGHPPGSEEHIFVGSKVPWHAITDGLPQREEY